MNILIRNIQKCIGITVEVWYDQLKQKIKLKQFVECKKVIKWMNHHPAEINNLAGSNFQEVKFEWFSKSDFEKCFDKAFRRRF